MQGDQILVMYQANGYLDAYCLGGSRTSLAPGGQGCPSTSNFYRIIHAFDTDMLAPADSSGRSQGFPGLWAATPYVVPMPVFTNVSLGSVTAGVTCASITGSACIAPTGYVPMSFIP